MGKYGFLPIFHDFAPTSKGCHFFVSGSFLSILFCLKAENRNFHFLICGIAYISFFGTVKSAWRTWHNSLQFSTENEQETASEGDVS